MTRRKAAPHTNVQRPKLNVGISLRDDGAVEIDPQFNKLAIEHMDMLYQAAEREDYDDQWSDDHKVAFFIADMIDGVLSQWEPPDTPDSADGEAGVPHINEAPVRDVYDLKDMDRAKAERWKTN